MKDTLLKILLTFTIISSIFLCGLLFLLSQKGNVKGGANSKLKDFQEKYEERATDTQTIAPTVYMDFSDATDKERLYEVARHTEVADRIAALKNTGDYTMDAPLVVYNPYGTNTLSLYVYFKTESPMKASYRISAQGSELATFTANCVNKKEYVREHEYLLLGLAKGTNRVSVSLTGEEGDTYIRNFYVTVENTIGQEREKLSVARGAGKGLPGDGLYVHFGNKIGGESLVLFYDNDGALRGEIPLRSGDCNRFLFSGMQDGLVYFNISDTQIAAMDRFGRVICVYTFDGYTIGKDYCFEKDTNNIFLLASKSGEDARKEGTNDRVLSLDVASGEYKELVNLGSLLKEYKELCNENEQGVLEWLTLNSIQSMGENKILLSAREPSAVLCITDLDKVPALSYIIADNLFFQGSGYEGELLTKEGTFASFFGANTLTLDSSEEMKRGIYYIYLLDNHIGVCDSRKKLDLAEAAASLGSSMKKGTSSYFCRYMINEASRTITQVESTPLAYTGYEGSVQILPNGNLLYDCAGRFTYGEYDADREMIISFTTAGDNYLGRVFKESFTDFYFGNTAAWEAERAAAAAAEGKGK